MARVGDYKHDTNLRAARENLKRSIQKEGMAEDVLADIEHLIDAKIEAALAEKRYG